MVANGERRNILTVFLCILLSINITFARKHRVKIEDDDRHEIDLITFGYLKGGFLSVNLTGLVIVPDEVMKDDDGKTLGFTLDKTVSTGISPYLESKSTECILSEGGVKEDDSVSIIFFKFNLKEKLVHIERKGADLQQLNIYQVVNGMIEEYDDDLTDSLSDTALLSSRQQIPQRKRRDINVRHRRDDPEKDVPKDADEKAKENDTNNDKNTPPPPKSSSSAAPTKMTPSSTKKATLSPSPTPESGTTAIIAGPHRSQVQLKIVNDSFPLTVDPPGHINTHFLVKIDHEEEEGLYNLFFHNCYNLQHDSSMNFTVRIIERNGDNYLSAGQMPLPAMFAAFSLVYFIMGGLFFWFLRKTENPIFKIHYMMLALLFVKSLSLFFHSINFYFIRVEGIHEEAFAILYYITYLMKGTLLFVTIVLIGAGWAFVKHILSDRDKKIFIIVIPLQVLANVAQIIIEETEEGQSQYTTWKEIFILVDLLCCGAILFPVVWSIRHLQEASQTDGKVAINLAKLKIFRHFYILIVCYIYFTRIIVYLLKITVPFQYEWLDELFKELATLAFFVVTGYKFRPATNNPYLQVATSDDETEMDEVVTDIGALEGVRKVNQQTEITSTTSTTMKQRESSHEFD